MCSLVKGPVFLQNVSQLSMKTTLFSGTQHASQWKSGDMWLNMPSLVRFRWGPENGTARHCFSEITHQLHINCYILNYFLLHLKDKIKGGYLTNSFFKKTLHPKMSCSDQISTAVIMLVTYFVILIVRKILNLTTKHKQSKKI